MMDRRRALMGVAEGGAEYDGIPVYVDNAYYSNLNKSIDDYLPNDQWFLTRVSGEFPSGNYTFGYTVVPSFEDSSGKSYMRYWTAINPVAISSDYWIVKASAPRTQRFTTPRTQVYTVNKEYAKYFFVKDPNGNYLIKGSAVE